MAQLAIKGHATRGSEVIALLEMLGGVNSNNLYGDENYDYYTIDAYNDIIGCPPTYKFVVFTLERFIGKYPYKVGDKVSYKTDNTTYFISKIRWENDKVLYDLNDYSDKCGISHSLIFDVEVEKLQPYKEETMQEKKINQMSLVNCELDEVEILLGDTFELKFKDGKYYAVKKQPRYPKSYYGCCDILQLEHTFELKNLTGDEEKLTDSFIRLLRCRDAYWKIAGEQMGLGKPWKPENPTKHYIFTIETCGGDIIKNAITDKWRNRILVFPTEEMRDAFYDSFKRRIEECKCFV